jgi:hypothetical protein
MKTIDTIVSLIDLYFCLILQMSDNDDDDDLDMAPNYEKMRGMGFICWREIPGTNDEVCYSNFLKIKFYSMIFFV